MSVDTQRDRHAGVPEPLADHLHVLAGPQQDRRVRPPTERYPYGLERAEDLAGIGIAVVIWASAAFAGYESVRKFIDHGPIFDR